MYVCVGGRHSGSDQKSFTKYLERWRTNLGIATTKAYQKGVLLAWGKWLNWCRLAKETNPYVNIYKPTVQVYCCFIDFYLYIYAPETVRSYLKRINTAAIERSGYPLNRYLNKLWIRRTFAAAAKRVGGVKNKKRLPLTVEILAKLRNFIDFSSNDDRAIWAILCVGVFALARIGELVPGSSSKLKVTLGAVSVRGGKGSIRLVGTKTDWERKGVTLHFFQNDSVCCPVAAMQAYLCARPKGSSSSPLFVDKANRAFTQTRVVDRLRTLLNMAGFNGNDFSGISLRRGGAQTLVRLRANDTIIMGMGRWRSSCFNRYLSVQEDDIQLWQQRMARATRRW